MPIASNPVFPVLATGAIALPFTRVAIWKSLMQESASGVQTPLQLWTYPRYRYTITPAFLRAAAAFGELQTLIAFFNRNGGKNGVFQFNDFQDNSTGADQLFGTGDGTTTQFQLLRNFGGFIEPVFAVNTVTNLKINGVAQSSPANYSVSNKGIVTFVTAPAAGASLTWTGTFLWFCRFDNDEQEFNLLCGAAGGVIATDPWGPLWTVAQGLTFTTIKFGA